MKKVYLVFAGFVLPVFAMAQWSQIGESFNGNESDRIGSIRALSLDLNGTTIAFGSDLNSEVGPFFGYAEVHHWVDGEWVQKGQTILGDENHVGTGSAVCVSGDGGTVAIGSSHGINSLGYQSGLVRVYDWVNNEWQLRGEEIEGEGNSNPNFQTDNFGAALDLSADGNFLIVGALANTPEVGVLQLSGHARVYHWNGTAWEQMGGDLDGDTSLEEYGHAVSINDGGNRIAIGGRSRNEILQGVGYAETFEWDGEDWIQLGDSFFGTDLGESLGSGVSLNAQGNTLAIGAPKANSFDGKSMIFDLVGDSWIQRGDGILGGTGAQSGMDVMLSSVGNTVVVGEPWDNSAYGKARVFEWNGAAWEQVEDAIDDAGPSGGINAFGEAVAMNSDGTVVAIGAPANDEAGFNAGQIKVFATQEPMTISEENVSTIKVFPNPSSFRLNFSKPLPSGTSIEMMSMNGKNMLRTTVSETQKEIDVSDLASGMYILHIYSESNSSVYKVLIER